MRPASVALASAAVLAIPASVILAFAAARPRDEVPRSSNTRPVAGTAVHYLTTAIVHSKEATPTGMIQRSTEIVELKGDLMGRVLYHPTSVIDHAKGTLVNTGHQVFSGTVLGSRPVLIHDDRFRFEVNLGAGTETGEVHLTNTIAGPKVRCVLRVVGTGRTPEGNPAARYVGECTFDGK